MTYGDSGLASISRFLGIKKFTKCGMRLFRCDCDCVGRGILQVPSTRSTSLTARPHMNKIGEESLEFHMLCYD